MYVLFLYAVTGRCQINDRDIKSKQIVLFLSIFSASHWQSEIHGDHMLSDTSVIMIIYIAGLSHLLTQHLSTVGRMGAGAASAASCALRWEIKGCLNVGRSSG